MLKKTLYFIFIFIFFILFNNNKIKAKEYCHLYLNDELYDSIELPFYLYNLEREVITTTNGMPLINYNKKTKYIDSLTKCELIEEKITYHIINMYNSKVLDYSFEEINIENQLHFEQAKVNINESIIKGLSTKTDEEPPTINGYEKKYISNIDNPINLELLIKNFTSHDNFDGNISSSIKIEYEEYTSNLSKIGTYAIILSSCDSSNNKTTITFYIEIIDTTPPSIKGKNIYTSYLSSPISIDEIKLNLSANDNSKENLTPQIYACEDLYSSNKNKEGTYPIYFCVYDSSNNISPSYKVTIEVKDDIPPIIEGLNYFTSYLSSRLTTKEIMYSLAASDNGIDISSSIFITNDLYTNYLNTIGEKKIYFQAKDNANNLSLPFEVTINLIDDIPPQIYGLNNFDSFLSSPLSITYLKQQITVLDNIDGNISSNIEIINDTYSTNLNNKGSFYITFNAKDSSSNLSQEFKITINNIDDVAPYFIGPNTLTYQLNQKPSLETILGQYIVKDNVDQNITYEIQEESYSQAISTGEFFIYLISKDSSNNISSPFIIKIELVEELIKVYNSTLLLPNSKLFSLEEINNLINFNSTYTLIEDTYSSNYSTKGNHLIKYKLKDNSILEIKITIYQEEKQKENIITKKKETFFSKIKRFFTKSFNYIKNFFKNLFL